MLTESRLGWKGRIKISVRQPDGRTSIVWFDNLITNGGRDLFIRALRGEDTEIKYLAWGIGTTVPDSDDARLANEVGRKAVTQQITPAQGALLTTTYLAPFDANTSIRELGWFGGAAATDDPNTGVMFARVLYTRDKTSEESIQVDRTDTLTIL